MVTFSGADHPLSSRCYEQLDESVPRERSARNVSISWGVEVGRSRLNGGGGAGSIESIFVTRDTEGMAILPEPWIRGPLPGMHPLVAPILYSFQQARED